MQSNWIKQADGSPNRPDAFKTFQSFKRFQTLARTRTPTKSPPLLEGDKERVARHHSSIPSPKSQLLDYLFAEQAHRHQNIFVPKSGGPVKTGQHVGDPEALFVLDDLVNAFFGGTEDKAVIGQPVEGPAQFAG